MNGRFKKGENEGKKEGIISSYLSRQFGSTLFTHQQIFSMLVPLILDSFFVSLIGMLTTAMISSSSQESVSAVSLVSPLYMLIYAVYNAISAGGTVVVAQYKGRGDEEMMKKTAGQLILATPLSAIICAAILIIFSHPLVNFLFQGVEAGVLAKAEDYLIGMAISMIFLAVYMSGFAVFRGLGETKKCLHLTIIINLLHFVASFVFINLMHLDILGSALSLNLARFVGGAAAVWMLLSPKSSLRVQAKHVLRIDKEILRKIFRIGIPFGMEQLFMNGGSMLVQIYIAQLGTVSVAANAVGNSAISLFYSAAGAVATLAVTVVGQSIGTGDKKLAERYGRKMILLGTWMIVISLVVMLPCMRGILWLYQAPENTLSIIYRLIAIVVVFMPFFWPSANILPSIMRAAGDAAFCSYFSLITMWVVRVGLGYVAAIPLGLGIAGVWFCMCLEWVVKTIAYWKRFRSGVWLEMDTV